MGAPSGPRRVAAFDFDGTLTHRDTLLPFLARVAGWPRTIAAAASVAPELAAVAFGRGNRDAAKERLLTRLLAGRPRADLAGAGVEYGRVLVERRLRPDMRDRVAWHQSHGHETVIVSASLDVYLLPVQRAVGIGGVVCTELEVDDHGICTGRMRGGNCRGDAKARRLLAYLGDAPVELWAYGNSTGDDAMLDMADHPVRVR